MTHAGFVALYNGDLAEAKRVLDSLSEDDYPTSLGLQACRLLDYVREEAGVKALDSSITHGRAASRLTRNSFDVHFMLGQAHAARYQRTGKRQELDAARQNYHIAERLVHQRVDLDSDVLRARILTLTSELEDTYVGARPLEFTTRNDFQSVHTQFPDAFLYDTSTHAPRARDFNFVTDLREFSPFMQYGEIPVPGTNLMSDSAEGVWQGLKVFKGRTDPTLFSGRPRTKKGRPQGHRFGSEMLSYVQARKQIFVPTIRHMMEVCVPADPVAGKKLELIKERAQRGKRQYLFDVDSVKDVNDTSGPLAHSSVIVDIINESLGL